MSPFFLSVKSEELKSSKVIYNSLACPMSLIYNQRENCEEGNFEICKSIAEM
jgi:hypothetical protein